MTEEQLDALDFDYGYEEFRSKELAKDRLAQYSWDERVSKCGMTYLQLEQLNQKMSDLEWKS
jgi:hypothetical protein